MAKRDVELVIRARNEADRAIDTIVTSLSKLAGAQDKAEKGADALSTAIKRGEGTAESFNSALGDDTGRTATKVAAAFDKISQAVDRARGDLSKQEAALAESEEQYRSLSKQAEAARVAIVSASIAAREGGGTEALTNRLRAAQAAYRELDTEASRLGQSITQAGARVAETSERIAGLERSAAAAQGMARLGAASERTEASSRGLAGALGAVVKELFDIGPASQAAANGMTATTREALNMRRAFAAFYGDSRRALSLMQRIRGEVLSMTATFVGFYAVFEQGRGVFDAFASMEAAENKLGAAFEGNKALVGAEISRLQDEAQRLGISFATLTDNYSKFLISAQAVNFETAETRKVFTQVSEAGRVLKLSNDQLDGVFTALTQIAGKGTLQMEELRQQLGDRLPGAVAIMARALGYGEGRMGEFYDAVENGQVDAKQALIAFGNELERTFGGQLQESLTAARAEVGRLQDAFFKRQLTAANAGFMDGLIESVRELRAFLDSEQGEQFFESLGAAAGRAMQVIPAIVNNFDLLADLFQVFVSLKVAQVFSGLVGNITAGARASTGFAAALATADAAIGRVAAKNVVLGRSLMVLRPLMVSVAAAARSMWIAIGGPIGLAVTALSFFATSTMFDVATSVEVADRALGDHGKTLDRVRKHYRDTAKAAGDFEESLKGVTETEVLTQRTTLTGERQRAVIDELNEAYNGLSRSMDLTDREQRDVLFSLSDATEAFKTGKISAQDYRERLDEIVKTAKPGLFTAEALQTLYDAIGGVEDFDRALEENGAVLRYVRGEATDTDLAILGLKETVDDAGNSFSRNATKVGAFSTALQELQKHIPGLAREIEKLERLSEIETDFQAALAAARDLPDPIMRGAAEGRARDARADATAAAEAQYLSDRNGVKIPARLVADIKREEALRNEAYEDAGGVPTIGYGHTNSTGTYNFGMGDQITDAQALDILGKDLAIFARRVDAAVKVPVTDAMREALISYDYNTGRIVGSEIIERLNNYDYAGAQEAIKNGINTANGEVLDGLTKRRAREADLFGAEGLAPPEAAGDLVTREMDAAEEAEEYNQALRERNAEREFELSLFNEEERQAAIRAAVREEEQRAQEAGVTLTAEQRAETERLAGALYDAEQAKKALESIDENGLTVAQQERLKALEKEMALLQEQRDFLQERAQYLEDTGDMAGAANAAVELEKVDTALLAVIEKARQFWVEMGGPGAEAAIQKLDMASERIMRVQVSADQAGQRINNLFADKISGAFDSFAQAVAKGEDPIKALGQAFQKAAAQILIELGQMIIKQAVFNALSGGGGAGQGGGGVGGFLGNLLGLGAAVRHSGGLADGAGNRRTVPAAAFARAIRYHSGGIAGLAPNEVPAVLERGEEILPESDPRHRKNGGGGGGAEQSSPMKIVNAFDAPGFLEAAMASDSGARTVLNYIRANSSEIRSILG